MTAPRAPLGSEQPPRSALRSFDSLRHGGEIVFEQHGLIIKPRTGLMVIFPSDRDHLQEVLLVVAGVRYSGQTCFTRQGEKAMTGV